MTTTTKPQNDRIYDDMIHGCECGHITWLPCGHRGFEAEMLRVKQLPTKSYPTPIERLLWIDRGCARRLLAERPYQVRIIPR